VQDLRGQGRGGALGRAQTYPHPRLHAVSGPLGWAKKLSWEETARSFHSSWEKVYQAVEYVVQWG
jgi:hypothetical protein